jgi:hypothetical protein
MVLFAAATESVVVTQKCGEHIRLIVSLVKHYVWPLRGHLVIVLNLTALAGPSPQVNGAALDGPSLIHTADRALGNDLLEQGILPLQAHSL